MEFVTFLVDCRIKIDFFNTWLHFKRNLVLFILELLQNNTIEERVTLLEIQVTDIREDLTTTDENVASLDQDVNFLFDEQVIQDERLFSLEEETGEIDEQLFVIDDAIESTYSSTYFHFR